MGKKPLLKPSNDLVFKMIFGNERHKEVLAGFLQAVLDLPVEEYSHIEIVDPHSRIYRSADDKLMILDIKLHTKSGHIIDIEMQLAANRQLRDRILVFCLLQTTKIKDDTMKV